MLLVKNLYAGYNGFPAIFDVSFEVKKNEIVSILGANGAGKTTLLRTIMGMQRVLKGQIIFEEENITSLPTHEIVKRGLILIPERRRIFTNMSVLENLQMGGYLIKKKDLLKERINEVFRLFPILKERKNQAAGTLSGGEQQMLAIGRGLILNPKMILLDEPSIGLAPKIVDQLYNTLAELRQKGITMLIAEQNIVKALSITHRALVLQRGRIIMQSSSEKLRRDPELISSYLRS